MRQSCLTPRHRDTPPPTPQTLQQLILCQRVPFLFLPHIDTFWCISWFNCLIHSHSVQEWFAFVHCWQWRSVFVSIRLSLYVAHSAGIAFLGKLYLHLHYFFIFLWTPMCSKCKNEDTQLLTICTFPVFSEAMYKIETCFLFINFYWKYKVFVEQWKFHISLKQSWFLWRIANATQNKEACVFLCWVLYPRNLSRIWKEAVSETGL